MKLLLPGLILLCLLAGAWKRVAVYDAFTREAPKQDSERLYFIARERGKMK